MSAFWSPEDVARLIALYHDEHKTAKEIALLMGRPVGSVQMKLQRLGVTQDDASVAEWRARRERAQSDVEHPLLQLAERFRPVELPPIPHPTTRHTPSHAWVVSSDHHWPLHDERAEAIILQAIERIRPTGYILNGDGPDLLALSAYPKDARHGKSWELRDEQHAAKSWWWQVARLQRQWGGALYETEANHSGNEQASRWRRWLNENAAALFGLDGFEQLATYQRFFHPEDAGVAMVPEVVLAGDLRVRHGELVRKHGGYSARAHGDKWQSSVMHGHTHRIGSSMKRQPGIPGHRPDAFLRTFETGCVCKLDADYCPGADWQQGFAVVHVDPESHDYGVELIQIVNGRATSCTLGGTLAA